MTDMLWPLAVCAVIAVCALADSITALAKAILARKHKRQ